jgi:hypothetical protein
MKELKNLLYEIAMLKQAGWELTGESIQIPLVPFLRGLSGRMGGNELPLKILEYLTSYEYGWDEENNQEICIFPKGKEVNVFDGEWYMRLPEEVSLFLVNGTKLLYVRLQRGTLILEIPLVEENVKLASCATTLNFDKLCTHIANWLA